MGDVLREQVLVQVGGRGRRDPGDVAEHRVVLAGGADSLGSRDVAGEQGLDVPADRAETVGGFRGAAVQPALVVAQQAAELISAGVAVCEEADGGEEVLVMVVVAAVSGDRERPVRSRGEHQDTGVLAGLWALPVEERAGEARRLAVWVVDEEVPEALELVEDDEVGLQGLHAGRREQAAELADQRVAPSRLIGRDPGARPAELVT